MDTASLIISHKPYTHQLCKNLAIPIYYGTQTVIMTHFLHTSLQQRVVNYGKSWKLLWKSVLLLYTLLHCMLIPKAMCRDSTKLLVANDPLPEVAAS